MPKIGMKTIPLVFVLAITAFSSVTSVTLYGLQTEASPGTACSTAALPGSAGTFTLCISKSTLHVNQPSTITLSTFTNPSAGGNLLFYSASVAITNNGASVFSSSQSCPSLFSCPVGPGQTFTVTVPWTATPPRGIDNVQATLVWDYGCRVFGCTVVAPPPATTSVAITIK